MMTTKKITKKESKKRLDLIAENERSQREKPEYKEMFEALVSLVGDDLETLRHFTTVTAIRLNEVIHENEKLCRELNDIHDKGKFFSTGKENPNVTFHTKLAVAGYLEQHNFNNPSVASFLAGVDSSKKSVATKGGNKRAEKFRVLKEFAIREFSKKKWKSTMNARDVLWSLVKDEATRMGVPLSGTTGQQTLYGWLLAHKKKHS